MYVLVIGSVSAKNGGLESLPIKTGSDINVNSD